MTEKALSTRSIDLLKTLVEMHIRDGQPVGSKTLHASSGLAVSPATIRNIMSDLEGRGYLESPHTSSGRVPTAAGYRFFVDSLLQIQPLDPQAIIALREELNPNRSSGELVQAASSVLAQITTQAGIVTVPKAEARQLRQVEFLPLSDNRVLVILVVNEREVQNRIIQLPRALSEDQLKAAADLVNQRFSGTDLGDVKSHLVREMEEARSRIDEAMAAAMQMAQEALGPDNEDDGYVVAGEGHLLDSASPENFAKLRELFDAFERKRDLLDLLERSSQAEGVQIFIGEEAGFEVFGDYSVITAPYGHGSQPLGVLGVIGPTRMAYERVIPMVDVTARMLTAALSK
ncbi:heat-inducible transcription repressor HrcA [Luminiphilus syltensis NOR5-1B]|uniref:Heat-inducible transcription repressor HrcA n=1 Tax=Luminiphilus syltensis NOR5-1B TaxID=565045 RepID=B8KWU4_9GAMM|nr:heat-inducible transcriptional repressor HrcA [Luminiphilus syltensis]EED36908.1 heat-inducible transcription repressor HrcA [Luminiphilus syltensis NOR5-1B]